MSRAPSRRRSASAKDTDGSTISCRAAEGTDTTRMPACSAAQPRSQSSRRGIGANPPSSSKADLYGQVASQHVGEVKGAPLSIRTV